jgi:hypothetical protein
MQAKAATASSKKEPLVSANISIKKSLKKKEADILLIAGT